MTNLNEEKSIVNTLHQTANVWEHIFKYLSPNDVIALSSVCKKFQRIVHSIYDNINLRCNFRLNTNALLNYAVSKACTSVNINYCYWLEPKTILELISRTNLHHLHVIECNINEAVMRAICELELRSFSLTYSDDWNSYFRDNVETAEKFFQKMTTLIVLFQNSDNSFIDIYANVLQKCKELQHLKLCDCSSIHAKSCYPESNFPTKSTLLPTLKSLVVHLRVTRFASYEKLMAKFLKAILHKRANPLEYVDFGPQTRYLLTLKSFDLIRSFSLPAKKSLILKGFPGRLSSFEEDASIKCEASNKNFGLYCLEYGEFRNFAEKTVSLCEKWMQDLYTSNCKLFDNVLKGVDLLSINCPQVTVLDLTELSWIKFIDDKVNDKHYVDQKEMAKNEALLEALAKLINLEQLWIQPLMLHCEYYSAPNSSLSIMPFWKVTKACEQLRQLHIADAHFLSSDAVIHSDSLHDIGHCKNLRVLQIEDFVIEKSVDFRLSEITKNCSRLQDLKFIPGSASDETQPRFILEDCLNFAKNLKKLKINVHSCFTKSFIDSLCVCENLTTIRLWFKSWSDEEVEYLIDSLPKIKNLYLFYINFDTHAKFKERLNAVFLKIKGEKPAFYASANFDDSSLTPKHSRVSMLSYFEV